MKEVHGKAIQSPVLLLPCPFCGSSAVLRQWLRPATPGYSEIYTHSVECSQDCVSTTDEVEAEWAIETWNRRAPQVRVVAGSGARSSEYTNATNLQA